MNQSYQVKLPEFEGPLDLLLHLVNELEIDIYDIPVSEITEQYMRYIHTMKIIELNIASEYLVMAATLLEMKSAMLLPKKEIQYEDEYEEDPREQLIERLIEYRKYKIAADHLKNKELAENQIYTRSPVQFNEFLTKKPTVQGDISIYDMLHALNNVFIRHSWDAPLKKTVNKISMTVEQRSEEIRTVIQQANEKVRFEDLFTHSTKSHIVTTFLAVLQLLKDNLIECEQAGQFEPIYLHRMEVV